MVKDIAIIIVKNSKGEYYINKRVLTKSYAPGLFHFGAGGKVEEGESLAEGARRELKEELAVECKPEDLKHLFSFPFDSGSGKKTRHIYLLEHEGPFVPTQREFILEETGWKNWLEIEAIADSNQMAPDALIAWNRYKNI